MTENFPLLPGLWEYDRRGQVQAGRRYWADGTVVAGQQYEYGYDDIGNRTKASSGGDGMGTNLRTAVSSSSLVNQLGSRQVPATFDVIGVARGTVSVGVDAQSPVTAGDRKGEYFRQEVTARASDAAAAYAAITVQVTTNGSGGTAGPFPLTQTGRVFVPAKNEVYSYDADGNLTQDGRWTYSWDGENRLTNMVSMALPNNPPAGTPMRVSFRYDAQGRRIYKGVFTSTTSTTPAVEEKYVYDGNGNVAALVSAASSAVFAVYEYGPFGEVIRCSGPMAKANPFRFSTKFQDDEMDLLYYGYRFYNAATGRWISRDPIQERGGRNLYGFARNDPLDYWDFLGQRCCLRAYNNLLTQPGLSHPVGHAVLHCDNGAHVSFMPGSGDLSDALIGSYGSWSSQEKDDEHFRGWGYTEECNSCLDEGAVLNWLNQQKSKSRIYSLCLGIQCADKASSGIDAGTAGQTRPSRFSCGCIFFNPGNPHHYEIDDLVDDSSRTPGGSLNLMRALTSNNCSRYKCSLKYGAF